MLINTLPLLEAKDSSEIENIVTTADRLFQHVQGDAHADHATKEALRYLKDLTELGVLREMSVGKEKLCSHLKLMQLLTKDSNDVTPYPRFSHNGTHSMVRTPRRKPY